MKTVQLIFSDSNKEIALEIQKTFLNWGMEPCACDGNHLCFRTKEKAYTDSAIVILSDEAVKDEEWQKAVRSVPRTFRMIPIGNTVDADYSNPDIIPTRIEEINSIRIDDALYDNIEDSLLTDPEIYSIKSDILSLIDRYKTSNQSESFLMTDRKKIRKYQEVIGEALKREKNGSVRKQYEKIEAYLEKSRINANIIFKNDLKRYIKNGIKVGFAVLVVVLVIIARQFMKRASIASMISSVNVDSQMASIRAIESIEALTNPFFPNESKSLMYRRLVDALDKNWENSPLGMNNYKWSLNDVAYAGDGDHLLAAEGDGSIVMWDVRTGQPIQRTKVSADPLACMAASNDCGFMICIDTKGKLYCSQVGGKWHDSGYICDIEFTDAVRVKLSEDCTRALAFDDKTVIILSLNNGTATEICKRKYSEIGDADFDEDGTAFIIKKQDSKWDIIKIVDEKKDELVFADISVNDICCPDLHGSTAAVFDREGQLVVYDSKLSGTGYKTGLVIGNPFAVAISEKGYCLYLDRNIGIRIYDYNRMLDIGDCLGFAFSANRIEVINDMAIAFAGGQIHSENIESLLPKDSVGADEGFKSYEGTYSEGKGIVKSVGIKNDYMIEMKLGLDKETTVVMDPSSRYFIGKGQRDERLMEGITNDYSYYSGLFIHFTGEPTLVSIIQDEDVVLIGGYDGSLYELYVDENGLAAVSSHTQVPSHSPVVRVYQGQDSYLIQDKQGNLWTRRTGYKTLKSKDEMVSDVKNRIRMSVGEDLLNMISKETVNLLELKKAPGTDGKAWE